MRTFLFFIILSLPVYLFARNFSHENDSILKNKCTTEQRLIQLVDSVLDLAVVTEQDVALLNYYTSILKNKSDDHHRVTEYNLSELSFYSASDEKILFPLSKLDSLPASFNLALENNYLGYYFSPCKGIVTSNFGWRDNRLHKGIDIDLNKGDKVVAAFDGKVRFAKKQGGFGNVVIIMHPNGLETVYAHLSKIKVKEGEVLLSG